MPFAADPNVVTGITAFAGGGAGSATQLTGKVNVVAVCATAADSVKLPANAGLGDVVVRNNGAAACNVFPPTGGTIDAGSVDAAKSVATVKGMYFFCTSADGKTWVTVAGA